MVWGYVSLLAAAEEGGEDRFRSSERRCHGGEGEGEGGSLEFMNWINLVEIEKDIGVADFLCQSTKMGSEERRRRFPHQNLPSSTNILRHTSGVCFPMGIM